MPQLSLYLDDPMMEGLRQDASREGKTLSKLLVGVEKSSRPEKARWLVDEFTLPFDVLPFDSDCAREYGRIRALLERSGKKIGHNDLFIAATALANNAVLVTNNMDEFKRVPGLSLECWYEMKWEG